MDKIEMLSHLSEFICENGLWNEFIDELRKKGYNDHELDAYLLAKMKE